QESQVVIKRLFVDVRRDGRMLQDRFDLGSEDETAVAMIEIKRLDADAIAHEHELLRAGVPKRDGVIAFDVVNEIEAAFFVKVEGRFGVGARSVTMSAFFEAGAESGVVIDLAVEDEPCLLITAVHRLVTGGGQIDDRQPAKAEAAAPVVEDEIAGV